MAEYGKLLSRIWTDPEFTKLDARSQQVYSLLISYSTRNLAGVLPMTLKRWAGCTSDATVENITAALRRLAAARFVVVDWDTEEVLIRTYIRNDEVYKQPNLMQAARKFCRQVESVALRWALFDELTKLPEHKNADQTTAVANALVDGVDRPPVEPIAEDFGEPFEEPIGEDPGVGVSYVSGVREHQHQHLQTAPTPTTPRKTGGDLVRARFGNLPTRTAAAQHIAQSFSDSLDTPIESGVLAEIAVQIDKCLRDSIPPPAIATGIREWVISNSWHPSQIPKFVAKAAAQSSVRPDVGKPTRKARDYDTAAQELLAEMGNA